MKALFHLFVLLTVIMFNHSHLAAQPIGTAIIHDRLTATDSTLSSQRMKLNTVASACNSPKPGCPGDFGNTGVFYKTYCYTNESANSECIKVKMQVNCAVQMFCAAYLGAFDPADVCSNYLADPGVSIANGGTDSMSFDVPSGGEYCVVASAINLGDTCSDFILKIEQHSTSWHGSILSTDSTQTQRIYLDGIRNTCQNTKQLCANPPSPGVVFRDGYRYRNTTLNDICIRAKLTNHSADTASEITAVAYLDNCSSISVCYNLAADAGVSARSNDSLWFTFLVPSGSDCIIAVYSEKDSVFCDNYVVKLDAAYTTGVEEAISYTETSNVFPNPVLQGENLTVIFNNSDYRVVEVYDVNAKKVFTKQFSADQKQLIITTSGLMKGIYLLKVSGEKESVTRKIIVD